MYFSDCDFELIWYGESLVFDDGGKAIKVAKAFIKSDNLKNSAVIIKRRTSDDYCYTTVFKIEHVLGDVFNISVIS